MIKRDTWNAGRRNVRRKLDRDCDAARGLRARGRRGAEY